MSFNTFKRWFSNNMQDTDQNYSKKSGPNHNSSSNNQGEEDGYTEDAAIHAMSTEYVCDEYDKMQAELFNIEPEATILQIQKATQKDVIIPPIYVVQQQHQAAVKIELQPNFDIRGSIFDDNQSIMDADEQLQQITELKLEDWNAIASGQRKIADFDEKRVYLSLKRGIPDDTRRFVWRAISDIEQLKIEFSHFSYKALRSRKSYAEAQILLDVPRTNIKDCESYFKQASTQQKLRNILVAYSNLNRELGYTQGMNFIVAVLLQHLDRNNCNFVSEEQVHRVLEDEDELEEDIFWIFVRMMEQLDLKFHYMDGFPGTFRAFRVLEQRMRNKIPEIFKKIEEVGCEMLMDITDTFQFFFFSYFTSLMIYKTPKDFSKRILDLYLYG